MKFFLDSANLEEIQTGVSWGVVDGVITGQAPIAKRGEPFAGLIRAICDMVDGDVIAEISGLELDPMIEQGRGLARIHKNVVVRCPLTREGIKATAALSQEGIRVNVTLCFSAAQALTAVRAGAYLVSPFVAQFDDTAYAGVDLIRGIAQTYRNCGARTKVLATSLRSPAQVVDAALAGADIGAMPLKVMDMLFHHPLGEDRAERFATDWNLAFQEEPALAR